MAEAFNGKITKIGIWELSEEQINQVASNGQQYNKDKTHRVALICEGIDGWIGVGSIKCNPGFAPTWRREIDGEYQDLREGAEVMFQYDIKGKYKNLKLKTFSVLKNGDGKATPFEDKSSTGGKSTGGGFKKDYTGVEVGHCINAALYCLKHKFNTAAQVSELSENLHDLTVELRREYASKNSNMSDYDVKAAVGHAILNACKIGGKQEVILANARTVLYEIVPRVTDYIKGGEAEKPKDDTTEKPKTEPKPEPPDDSIPF